MKAESVSEHGEGVTPSRRTVASCLRSSQHRITLRSQSHNSQCWQTLPLLGTVAPRVIDEKLDFKHPLETIEMSP